MGFLTTAGILIVAYIAYSEFVKFYDVVILGKPPLVENSWRAFLTGKSKSHLELMVYGFETYNKKGKPFRYYEGYGRPHYVMPPTHFASVRKRMDADVGASEANEDNLILNPFLGEHHVDIVFSVRTSVTRSIDSFIPRLIEEISTVQKLNFPTPLPENLTKLKPGYAPVEIDGKTFIPTNIHEQSLPSIARILSRILLGKNYSENPEFPRLLADFAHGIVFQAFLLRIFPTWFSYLIAPLFNTYRRVKKVSNLIRPDVVALIRNPEFELDENLSEGDKILPMLVKHVLGQERYQGKSEDEIVKEVTGRLLGISFGGIDTTSLTLTHTLHDLFSNPFEKYAGPIKAQADAVFEKYGGRWSTKALGELTKLDSFIKEVQRMHPIGLVMSKRQVLKPGGMVFKGGEGPLNLEGFEDVEGEEVHVPQWGNTQMPLWCIHRNPAIYKNPDLFDGFRFENDRVASSQPSDRFLAFGHGKHACPGRFLALTIIKLFIINMLDTMEFQSLEKRPEHWFFNMACLPDFKTPVLLRRKEKAM